MATHLVCDSCSASLAVTRGGYDAPEVLDFHERHGACGASVRIAVSTFRKRQAPSTSQLWG